MSGGNLWKPVSDTRPGSVFLSEKNLGKSVAIYDADTGKRIATGQFDTVANGGRYHYRFSGRGSSYGNNIIIMGEDGTYFYIQNAGARVDNLMPANNKLTIVDGGVNPGEINKVATGDYDYSNSQSNVPGIKGVGNIAAPELIDPSLNKQVSMERTELEFTDPIETLREIAKQNKGQLDENFLTAMEQAGKLSEAETQQLIDYLDVMSPYQRQLIGIENAFNQQEKLKAAETAMPGIQSILNGEIKNAQTLANGKMLTTAEDLALEQTARSAGADAAWTRGLGDDSLVRRTLSNQLSVSQRQALMQQGQTYLQNVTQLATQVLMDSPQKATLGSQIPAQPRESIGQLANQQYAALNQLTTMSPEAAQSSIVGQRSTQAQLDFNTRQANAQLEENYITRGIEIAAQNIAAMNQFNQNVLTDQTQTTSAQNKQRQMDYLETLFNWGSLSREDYQRLRENIDAGFGFDPTSIDSDFWSKYYKERGLDINSTAGGGSTGGGVTASNTTSSNNTSSNTTTNTTGTNATQQTNATQRGGYSGGNLGPNPNNIRNTGFVEDGNTGKTDTTTPVVHKNSVYKEGYSTKLLVQADGTITLPDFNYDWIDVSQLKGLQLAGVLGPKEVGGILK